MEKLKKKFVYDKLCVKISFFRQYRQYSAKYIWKRKKKLSKNGQDQKIINLPKLVCYEKS